MTAPVIQAEYETLETIAKQFDEQADGTGQMTSNLIGLVDQLQGGGWQGDAAVAFYAEMEDDIFPALKRLEDAFGSSGETTREIVNVLQDAEQEAANQFQIETAGTDYAVGSAPNGTVFSGGSAEGSVGISVGASAEGSIDGDGNGGGGIRGFLRDTASDAAGWVGNRAEDVGDFIVDHRNEIAIGAAVVGAGVLTVATGGAASPLLVAAVGAGAAGGTTLGINAASSEYELFDGVVTNTLIGGAGGYLAGAAPAVVAAATNPGTRAAAGGAIGGVTNGLIYSADTLIDPNADFTAGGLAGSVSSGALAGAVGAVAPSGLAGLGLNGAAGTTAYALDGYTNAVVDTGSLTTFDPTLGGAITAGASNAAGGVISGIDKFNLPAHTTGTVVSTTAGYGIDWLSDFVFGTD